MPGPVSEIWRESNGCILNRGRSIKGRKSEKIEKILRSTETNFSTKENNLSFIHPFDDPDVIAGQGTIGKEILDQAGKDLDAVFVPVGGGGLLAGIGAYIKNLRPDVKIIGVYSVLLRHLLIMDLSTI